MVVFGVGVMGDGRGGGAAAAAAGVVVVIVVAAAGVGVGVGGRATIIRAAKHTSQAASAVRAGDDPASRAEYCSAAFNCLVAVVAATQDAEKLFAGLLFGENTAKVSE